MQPKTEELLNLLLWSADRLMHPTFRNLTDSYEAWAYRNGFMREVQKLERKRVIECDSPQPNDRLYRLTEQGRLHALGGRDPELQWSRVWDGHWRLVLFDVPRAENTERDKLRRYLRVKAFGCLQQSVWITPDPLEEQRKTLLAGRINVKSLILLEARPCADESDAQIVAGAWDFERINRGYAQLLRILAERPTGPLHDEAQANSLQQWAATERQAWLDAVTLDPLLPARLLPSNYLGQTAWRRRVEVLGQAGRQLQTFSS